MVTRLKQANESVQSSYEDMQARLENQHTVQRFLGQKFRVKQDELREVQQLWISFLHTCMSPTTPRVVMLHVLLLQCVP